jgi:hypothetical protein
LFLRRLLIVSVKTSVMITYLHIYHRQYCLTVVTCVAESACRSKNISSTGSINLTEFTNLLSFRIFIAPWVLNSVRFLN